MSVCQIHKYPPDRNAPCANEATHLYMNGGYRRLECDEHAAITRSYIRRPSDPDAPKIIPLTPLAPPAAQRGDDGE